MSEISSSNDESESHFPLLIKYLDTDDLIIVNTPDEIDRNRKFTVVRTSERPDKT